MWKKILYTILIIAFISVLPTKVKAIPSGNILFEGPTIAKSEEEISIKIDITTTELDTGLSINEIKLDIPYDKDILTFQSIEKPSTFTMSAITSTEGIISVALNYIVDPIAPTNFTLGNILTLKFKTNSLTEDKTTTITPEKLNVKYNTIDSTVDSTMLSSTYSLNVTKKEEVIVVPIKSSNNYLKTLAVVGYGLDKQFTKETTNYSLSVASDMNELTIQNTTEDAKAKAVVTGNRNLKTGTNNIIITVTAEDGTTRLYQITVTKTPSDNNYLKTLQVEGYELKETFNKYTLKYTLNVEPTIENIVVNATSEDTKSKVVINNVDTLEVGKNTITITVTAENKEEQQYVIEVTRKGEETLEIPKDSNLGLGLAPVEKESKTVPIALGTTGGIMLGAMIGIFIIQKRRGM